VKANGIREVIEKSRKSRELTSTDRNDEHHSCSISSIEGIVQYLVHQDRDE
jgi:hypothetical protein